MQALRMCFPILCVAGAVNLGWAQTTESSAPMPRDYRGVSTHVDGIFVTPVPNAPFVADVQIVSKQPLPGGGERVVTTVDHIGRSSSGRIHNEAHHLVPATFKGEPHLRSVHIYDPNTRMSIFLNPDTLVARETVLSRPMQIPARAEAPAQQRTGPDESVTQLGDHDFEGVALKGTRKTCVIPAEFSETGQPVTVTDEYWYSPELSVYMVIKHDDPRSGEQLVAVSKVERSEPPAEMMNVPADYKVVDETMPARPVRASGAPASTTP